MTNQDTMSLVELVDRDKNFVLRSSNHGNRQISSINFQARPRLTIAVGFSKETHFQKERRHTYAVYIFHPGTGLACAYVAQNLN